MIRRLIHFAIAVCAVGCSAPNDPEAIRLEAPYGRGIEFTDKANQTQSIEIGDAGAATIRCYCQSHRVEMDFKAREITLEIAGTYSIGGYHGSAEDAGARPIPEKALHFSFRREGQVVILESPEWEYIHHSFLIDDLVVRSPIPVHFDHFTYEQLENRNSEPTK